MDKTITINSDIKKEILLYALTFLKSNMEVDVIEDIQDYIDLPEDVDKAEEAIVQNIEELINEII